MTICKEDGENGLEAANFTGVWKVPGYGGEEESAGGVFMESMEGGLESARLWERQAMAECRLWR